MNAIEFFHQWLIQMIDKHKFIVISYKDNEQFNVAIMSFRNNFAYVQRQIDVILRQYRVFVRIYIDDIVVFNKILKKYLKHLTKMFELFRRLNIALKSFKIFLKYFIVVLLEQKIDNFEFIIIEKKLKIIFKFQFFVTLKQLKTYLDLIEWIRNYVSYYVQLTNSLQIRKTFILKNFFVKSNARKRFNNDICLNIFIDFEIVFYEIIQKVFFKLIFFVHHNKTRQLYVDINASHERDFDVTIFHVKNNQKVFIKDNIEFILFLNKIFTSIEIKYWFTKLKIVDLIWFVKKIRHMIEIVVVTFQIIIYIDYSITTNIVKQTKMIFNNTNKLNFQLMRAFTYLSQYRFDVRHKLEKQHIVFDVFFKLFFNVESIKKTLDSNQSKNILDMIYYITLIKIFDEFKSKLKKIYRINKRWVKIMKLIKSRTSSSIVTNSSIFTNSSIVKNLFTNISSIVKRFFISSSI